MRKIHAAVFSQNFEDPFLAVVQSSLGDRSAFAAAFFVKTNPD